MEKQIVRMGKLKIKVYIRHSAGCARRGECKCIRWLQYQLDGKQIRETTEQWTWNGAVKAAEARGKRLEGLNDRNPTRTTIEAALVNWLAWREKQNLGNQKQKGIKNKLLAWSSAKGIFFLDEISKPDLLAWRNEWTYRTGDSSSLKVHWCILGSFFSFCAGADFLEKNPFPKGPQFRVRFRQKPVVPITRAELDRLIATIDLIPGWDAVQKKQMLALVLLMWHSGLAITDAITLKRSKLEVTDDGYCVRTNRQKTDETVYVPVPEWVATKVRDASSDDDYFFWTKNEGKRIKRTSLTTRFERYFLVLFKAAKVKATSHGFRHAFATHHLALGRNVADVAKWLGHSPSETYKTYQHWIPEAQKRLNSEMYKSWEQEGLDTKGNPISVQ